MWKAVSIHDVAPSRRSHSPDRPFLNPRSPAFLFPRSSVTDPPWVRETAKIGEAFPIPRLDPFPFPRVALSAFPRVDKCCRPPGGSVVR